MKVLFAHQNMPGQFGNLALALAREPGSTVLFATQRKDRELPGVGRLAYEPARAAAEGAHHYLRLVEEAVLNGQAVARVMMALKDEGFEPDVIVGHPGWGETLFAKDIFPRSGLVAYCEFFFRPDCGLVVGTDTEQTLDQKLRTRVENAHLLLALETCDRGWSPTAWQRSRFPEPYQQKIDVVFDGVDTDRLRPDPDARLILPDGQILSCADEVITYVSRGLEPQRGFPQFARALPAVLQARPRAQVVVAGEDKPYYGAPPGPNDSWRALVEREGVIDPRRVHFVNRLPYDRYVALLQVSSVHVYLTTPFVLSWSFFEAMAAGCLVVGSRSPPVLELLRDGVNGLATSFDDPRLIAEDVVRALEHPGAADLRRAARATILDRYSLSECLPKQVEILRRAAEAARR
jgi:glycosyltransferase involved in cell wall biosynthesis